MNKLILILSILTTAIGVRCMSAHAMATRAEITRRDLNETLHPEDTHKRVERIASATTCYQLVIDNKPLPRCACVKGNDEHATLSEVVCLYAQVMGIPVFPIEVSTSEKREELPLTTKKPASSASQ